MFERGNLEGKLTLIIMMPRKRSRSGSFGSANDLRRSDVSETSLLQSIPQAELSVSNSSSEGDRGAGEMDNLRSVMGLWTESKAR